jgi:hypothetical protein
LNGGTFTGAGSIVGGLTLSGGTFSPGNSPGEFTATNATWNGGASFVWELNNATGLAETNWDLLTLSNALTINANAANKFTLLLTSLTLGNAAGDVANFDPAQNYSFDFVNAASIASFSADAFTLDLSGFTNSFTGLWSITSTGTSLALNYTGSAIPEPGTYVLFAGAAVLGFAIIRRRRSRAGLNR